MHPDEGFMSFKKMIQKYSAKMDELSETDTRCKIIDEILKNCLGYSEENIKREPHVDSGYIDYLLQYNGTTLIVIEAKRAGDYFEIPASMKNRRYKVNASISTVENLMAAMEQARSYCNDIGCKYAIVFNGHQMVLFTPITVGHSWKEGYCYIFNGFQDIEKNFHLFWNMLSYERVINGALVETLDKGKRELKFERLLDSIHNPDEGLVRNDLYTYTQPICEEYFSELIDERSAEALKECYVYGRSNKFLLNDIENQFVDKLPNYLQKYKIKDILENNCKSGVFQKEYLEKSYTKPNGALMVLLGGIGSGKSTFIHRFFKIILSERENLIWFYIDFRNSTYKEQDIEEYILKKIYQEWKEKYEESLKTLLEKAQYIFDESNYKDSFLNLIKLLQQCKISITLVIDNVDQHDRVFQERLFILASHLKDYFGIITIIALREESFLISNRIGVFDAYDIPKFHIASPNFLGMILKRIDWTIKSLQTDKYNGINHDDVEQLILYFSIIRSSLTSNNKQSKQLVSFIDSISVGNMRDALSMFNNFIKSGNINIKEIFEKHKANEQKKYSNGYQISYHQFLKAIILGEYKYYSQDRSNIINIFDFDMSITDSHFNLLRILNYLQLRKNKHCIIGRGYILIDEVIKAAENVSIRREVIYDSLQRLSKYSLVEFNNQSKVNIADATYVKITHAGDYYLDSLSGKFVYLDLIFIDTPISNSHTSGTLKENYFTSEMKKRLLRTRCFIDYLVEQEDNEFKNYPEYLSNEFTNRFFAQEIKDKFNIEEKNIIKDVDPN